MIDVLRIVLFLLWVNGLPPLVSVLARGRVDTPFDRGRRWRDGHPLFGRNKTLRGLAAATAGGTLTFPLLGQGWWVAGITAILAMTGDLLSSFIKRRFDLESGHEVIGLDQLFESLFPLLFLNIFIVLSPVQNVLILALFILISFVCSRLWRHITERPPPEKYPRVVRSAVSFREWRACHTPFSRWQIWFNLSSFLTDQIFLTWFFRLTGLYTRGQRNAMALQVERRIVSFRDLPASFDGLSLLLLTDLHLDGLPGLTERLIEQLPSLEADICLIGGDLRMKTYGSSAACLQRLKELSPHLSVGLGTFGVLGNHDCIEMLPYLEAAGVIMLVNDAWPIRRNGEEIWLMGVDDPHYYRLDDAAQAAERVPAGAFSIFLAHSPEAFREAAAVDTALYLCGHTHGGQVCLVPGVPILTNSRAPRFTAAGQWRYATMQGYTSRGVGPSSIPVRFNCPGEITLLTLRRTAVAPEVDACQRMTAEKSGLRDQQLPALPGRIG